MPTSHRHGVASVQLAEFYELNGLVTIYDVRPAISCRIVCHNAMQEDILQEVQLGIGHVGVLLAFSTRYAYLLGVP